MSYTLHQIFSVSMLKTILILLFTLFALPPLVFYFGESPTEAQWQMIYSSGYLMLGFALLSFVLAELTKNYSQTDKLWSITPVCYAFVIAYMGDFTPRLSLMAALIALWGIRLTLNFGRRGGYSLKFWTGDEDYRWAVLREKPLFKEKPLRWSLFNFFFISFYQHALIWFITLPLVLVAEGAGILSWGDYLLAALVLFFLLIETLADQQQWVYQQEKHRRRAAAEELGDYYALGFTHTGLWAWMRHPNYMAEQAIWFVVYLFSVYATGQFFNWSFAGALLLFILFHNSSEFSEAISAAKYPRYKDYQKQVGRFLPLKGSFRTSS